MTREELIKILNEAGVEYIVAAHVGNLLKINFWVEENKEDK